MKEAVHIVQPPARANLMIFQSSRQQQAACRQILEVLKELETQQVAPTSTPSHDHSVVITNRAPRGLHPLQDSQQSWDVVFFQEKLQSNCDHNSSSYGFGKSELRCSLWNNRIFYQVQRWEKRTQNIWVWYSFSPNFRLPQRTAYSLLGFNSLMKPLRVPRATCYCGYTLAKGFIKYFFHCA